MINKEKITKHIIKKCGMPEYFVWEHTGRGSFATDIMRMREYVHCVDKVEKAYKKRYGK